MIITGFSGTKTGVAIKTLCMVVIGLLFGVSCFAQGVGAAFSADGVYDGGGILDMDALYAAKCNDWSQLHDPDKIKVF